MHESLEKIKLNLEHVFSNKTSYKKRGIRPGKHWKIILITTQILLVILGFIAFYLYDEINNGRFAISEVEENEGEVKINVDLLKNVMKDLSSKEESLIQIKAGRPIPSDPSL